MSNISGRPQGSPLALQASGSFQSSTDVSLASLVGNRFTTSDGRELMLVSVGATAISTGGLLTQDAAIVANHQGLVVTAVQAYSNNGNTPATVTVTLGATALTAQQYQGGFAMIDSGSGIGQTLRIASNPAALASGTGVTIVLEDAPNTALTTSSTVCLLPPHGANIILNPTTSTGAIVGATIYPLAAGTAAGGAAASQSYGFVVVQGLVAGLSDATVASVGQSLVPSVATAGAVSQSGGTGATIGFANQTGVSAKARSIFINL